MRNGKRRRINVQLAALLLPLATGAAFGRPQSQATAAQATLSSQAPGAREEGGTIAPRPLAELIEQAERQNPQVRAARRAWQAAAQVPSQVSTLPDPQFTVQQFAVGSPRPFAGFSNSDFAYIGLGVSQDLPYPGKLRLRGEMAKQDAAAAGEQVEAVERSVVEQLKAAYFRLAYEVKALDVLERDGKLLDQVEKIADARYRVGQGNQQDVLKAQLERTKLLRDIDTRRQAVETTQAELREILNRPSNAADITPQDLTETPLAYNFDQLRSLVRNQNPQVREQQERVQRQGLQVELARKDFLPDFNVQYMWQHTAEQFRDYYMLSFGVRVPIHWARKQRPQLAQAVAELDRSRRSYEAQVQQTYFDLRDQYLAAQTAARVLKIYREGLIPQATATFDAGLAAYQAGREDFQTLLSSFLDVLDLDVEYWQTLAGHETALARLEQLTGATLR